MYNPTEQQKQILNCNENCVVVAGPGSGKTSTIAQKILRVTEDLHWYEGVAAISFTNKASNELSQKSRDLGINVLNSFFGTIDSFYIGNILIPFGKRFFGTPPKDIVIDKFDGNKDEYVQDILSNVNEVLERYQEMAIEKIEEQNFKLIDEIKCEYIEFISGQFQTGSFDLRLVSSISNVIFLSSKSCRNYFKSRFKYLFIDEFQDSEKDQYELFLRISEIGVKCWAIGDVNQSIFRFANKSADFLRELLTNENFNKLPMDINHRCHPSIDLYSRKLLGYKEKESLGNSRVYKIHIDGTERDIGNWFENQIEDMKQKFDINKNSSIGVLAAKDITLEQFLYNLDIPNKFYKKNILDQDQTSCSVLLSKLISLVFDKNKTVYNFVNNYFDRENKKQNLLIKKMTRLVKIFKQKLSEYYNRDRVEYKELIEIFSEIATHIYPHADIHRAKANFVHLLKNKELLYDFIPARDNEIQLMNLHKSKGLEFDIVIHLDLYQFILPSYDWIVKRDIEAYKDSLNLHYVGVTRAKKALFLTTSSKRFQTSSQSFINGETSEFMVGEIENYQSNW
ncbi:UvrD-helicase domain-containing protein [Salinicoccus luteus]|uniref:UvrD-helicase domain-containing protein n=1 Tax=Salinicoccus luteus TaxID=367840 RepID=UPI0004E1282D|nr:ATP-dependent helicase [Salinicoccus luteus]